MQRQNCIDSIDQTLSQSSPCWRAWVRQGAALLRRDALALTALVQVWSDRSRQRCQLAGLNDRELKDIGLTRLDALREIQKPFWRS